MKVNEKMKKLLSSLLCLCMMVQNAPVMAYAAAGDGLCQHHPEHTAECGYVAAVEGVACACEATDESGEVLHTGGCGYVAAVEGHECHFQCPECASNVGDGEPSEEPTEEPGDETPVCTCEVKCGEEGNADCEVCGVDYTKCTGTDTAADYAVVDTVTDKGSKLGHKFVNGKCIRCNLSQSNAETGDRILIAAATQILSGGAILMLLSRKKKNRNF